MIVHALCLLLLGSGPAPLTLPKGRIVEGVETAADPSQTYAVYLPTSYDPARRQPVLLVFDPRGRATLAAEIFRPAAERLGWVIVSSHDTRSDGPVEPNQKAIQALWPEVLERYASDPRRVYAAGFSGGGMLTLGLGVATRALAGVVDVGGRRPEGLSLEGANFAHYGAAGRQDFNFLEMREVDRALEAESAAPRRLDAFDGRHQWLPPELASRALDWLEVVAMKEGRREREPSILARAFAGDMAAGGALEAASRRPEALRHYDAVLRTFDGLVSLQPAERRRAALAADPKLAAARREEEKAERYERANLRRMSAALNELRNGGGPPVPGRFRAGLGIEELRRRSRGEGLHAEAARRGMEWLFSQTSFYLARTFFEEGDMTRALLVLQLAAEIRPGVPSVEYNLACAYARTGGRTQALAALERAVGSGFKDVERLRTDPDLAAVREEPRFRALVDEVARTSG